MQTKTKWSIGIGAVVLVILFSFVFTNTGLYQGRLFPLPLPVRDEITERIPNKAEIVKMIIDELMRPVPGTAPLELVRNPVQHFTDVPPSHWAFIYIETAYAAGWAAGVPDGQFYPERKLNRAEFAATVYRAFNIQEYPSTHGAPYFNDVPDGAWFSAPINALYGLQAIKIDFKPSEPATMRFVQDIIRNMPRV